jgi:hypothetical protein
LLPLRAPAHSGRLDGRGRGSDPRDRPDTRAH